MMDSLIVWPDQEYKKLLKASAAQPIVIGDMWLCFE